MHEISAGGIVFHDRQILILRKFNGNYCMPKGRVERGETFEETAIREVKEETNIDGEIQGYVGRGKYTYRRGARRMLIHKEVHWFLMCATSLDAHAQAKEGFERALFVQPEEALRWLRYRDEKTIVQKAIRMMKDRV